MATMLARSRDSCLDGGGAICFSMEFISDMQT